MKTKFFLFSVLALLFAACNNNEPSNAFVGTWETVVPEGEKIYDIFVITSDSIKAINAEQYHAHYKILRDSVIELERCWMPKDYEKYISEAQMYFDESGYLIIQPFDLTIAQNYPTYVSLKLTKH